MECFKAHSLFKHYFFSAQVNFGTVFTLFLVVENNLCMTENRGGGKDGRNDSHSGPVSSGNQRFRHKFPNGFEGMNFEQIREPYNGNSHANRGNANLDMEYTSNRRNEG